jgi:hypothetical protein
MRKITTMLFFVCERCKFSSPKAALCQTCGAKLNKEVPTKEVLYRVQDHHEQSILSRAGEICEQAGDWVVGTWNHFAKTKSELTKPGRSPLPPENQASI